MHNCQTEKTNLTGTFTEQSEVIHNNTACGTAGGTLHQIITLNLYNTKILCGEGSKQVSIIYYMLCKPVSLNPVFTSIGLHIII